MPNIAKTLTFYTKYIRLSQTYAQLKIKVFQNEIKFENFNFNTFKGFLILTKLGKIRHIWPIRKIRQNIRQNRQIYELSLNFGKLQLATFE